MKLFDSIIQEMTAQFDGQIPASYPYEPGNGWKDVGHSELVMMRDAAFELGGSGLPTVNCTCVTTNEDLISQDEILVYGKDLPSIRSDVSFMRLVVLCVDDFGDDEEEAYNAIKQLEFVRYNVFPEGYMIRVSSESNQEQVRVSKKAVSSGINFRQIGNTYIKRYHEIPGVRHVKVIFATEETDLKPWIENAKKVDDITKTLTHILDGIPTDCGHCDLKPVCDTVDGLKEMHMNQRKGGAANV